MQGLWGIEHVEAICEGGPFDGKTIGGFADSVTIGAPRLTVGGRFAYMHEGQWAYYLVTREPAPLPREPQTRAELWRTTGCRIARFDGFEPVTDEQLDEIERLLDGGR
jgi:hypothetical protein